MRHTKKHKKDVKLLYREEDTEEVIKIPNFIDRWEYVDTTPAYKAEIGLLDFDNFRIRFVQD